REIDHKHRPARGTFSFQPLCMAGDCACSAVPQRDRDALRLCADVILMSNQRSHIGQTRLRPPEPEVNNVIAGLLPTDNLARIERHLLAVGKHSCLQPVLGASAQLFWWQGAPCRSKLCYPREILVKNECSIGKIQPDLTAM